VHRSSPDLSNAPTQARSEMGTPAPIVDGRVAQPQVTTFRTGVGEVTVPPTLQGGRRGKLVAGVVALAVLGGGAYFFLGGSKPEPAPVAVAAPKAVAATTPAPGPAPTPAPVAKPTPAVPAAPKKITVRLATDPQGAQVFDVVGGASLGTTPLSLTRPRGAALKVRLAKDGYVEATRDVPLDEDQALEFALDRKPAPKPHAHKAVHREDDGPAKL
jgi:hypothetical protein